MKNIKNMCFFFALTAFLCSCGESASEEAERLRNELKSKENEVLTDRAIRERNN